MGKLKSKILTWLADDAPESTPARGTTYTTTPTDSVPAQVDDDVPDVVLDDVDDLPIYTAPAVQIDYWHAFGDNGFLQTLLSEYNLDYSSPNVNAFNHFKIGLNKARHEATFAIDYSAGRDVHYYAITFNEMNTAPIDKKQARRVLEKVSRLREARRRFEPFGDFIVERFDEAN